MNNLPVFWPLAANRNRRLLGAVAFGLALVASPANSQEQTFDCVLEPSESVRVGSPVVGVLEKVLVTRGDAVTRGQVIARLQSEAEKTSVEINRIRSASTARIEAERARVSLGRKQLERASALLESQTVTAARYDELKAELEFAENALAREVLENRLARLEYARSGVILAQRTIRSPIQGVVTERALSAGEFVRQDSHIVTLVGLDPLHVEVFLPVAVFPKIEVGMTARVEPHAPVSGTYEATVTVVDRVFDSASGSFGVRLSLPNADGHLPGGHRCQVSFAWD